LFYHILALRVLNYSIILRLVVGKITHLWLRERLVHDLLLAPQTLGAKRKTKSIIIPIGVF
jgi:hypothetical protein